MPTTLVLAIFCALIAGFGAGLWLRHSWGRWLAAAVVIPIANSALWHLIEAFVLYPASRRGSENWAWITVPWLAHLSVVPAIVGILLAAAVRRWE